MKYTQPIIIVCLVGLVMFLLLKPKPVDNPYYLKKMEESLLRESIIKDSLNNLIIKNMKLTNLLIGLILFTVTSQKIVYGQESDTLCLPVSTVKHLARTSELYYLCDSLNKINEEEIRLFREVIEEKQVQESLNEGLLNQFRNEIDKLRRHRMLLGVGLGASIAVVLLIAL